MSYTPESPNRSIRIQTEKFSIQTLSAWAAHYNMAVYSCMKSGKYWLAFDISACLLYNVVEYSLNSLVFVPQEKKKIWL